MADKMLPHKKPPPLALVECPALAQLLENTHPLSKLKDLFIVGENKKKSVTDNNYTYGGEHCIIYRNVKSLCCIPEANITLWVNST